MNQSTIDLATTNATITADQDLNIKNLKIVILSVIFVLTVLGNSSVIIALVASKIKIQRMYYFLLHLSISDLITAFANVLPQLIWIITVNFYFSTNILCKFIKYIQILGPYLSSYVLVVTAIDRYQAICFPLANSTWTERRAKFMICIAWSIALTCCLPQAFIFSYEHIAKTNFNETYKTEILKEPVQIEKENTEYYFECWGSYWEPYGVRIYVMWYVISIFFVPLIVLVFTYFNICKVIWINARHGRANNKLKKSTNKKCASSRTLIFHSKLESSLSKQRSEHDKYEENNLGNSGSRILLENKLSTESKNSISQFRDQINENSNKISITQQQKEINVERTTAKNSCRAQNGQNSSSMNNQINGNNQTILQQTTTNDKLTDQTKSAPLIFASRTQAQSTKLSKAKIKTIKITLIVIICYISCSLPFCCVQIWANFFPDAQKSPYWTGPLIHITMLLPSLNSCVNPFIYLLLNRNLLYTLLKLLFGNKCINRTDSQYPNEITNQRLSISMHKSALTQTDTIESTTNSPTTGILESTSLGTPKVHLMNNSSSISNVDNIIRKNRLKRITSTQSVKNDQYNRKEIENLVSCSISVKMNLNQTNQINSSKIRIIDTMATIQNLNMNKNKINIEKCTNQMQIKNFNLPSSSSEILTIHKDQQRTISYRTSSSAPDLISVNK